MAKVGGDLSHTVQVDGTGTPSMTEADAELRKRIERLEKALLYLAGAVQPTFAFNDIRGKVREMLKERP